MDVADPEAHTERTRNERSTAEFLMLLNRERWQSSKPPLFLPSKLVADGVAIPDGWLPHPMLDGYVPPPSQTACQQRPPKH